MPSGPIASAGPNAVSKMPAKQLIFVMGVTGVGKSTFIQYATGHPVQVGTNLKPCTKKVETYQIPGTEIYLLDTPGFDDPDISDTDILQSITEFLEDCRNDNVQIMGGLYIHPITETKMKRSGITNLLMFRKIVGKDKMKSIRLVTTKWTHEPRDRHESNEHQLATTPEYWKPLLDAGADMVRFGDSWESAMDILKPLVQGSQFVPRLLEEVDQGLSVPETGAGQVIIDKVDEALRIRDKEIADFMAAQKQAEKEKDAAYAEMLAEERKAREADRERLVEEQRKMQDLRNDIEARERRAREAEQRTTSVKQGPVTEPHANRARFGRWMARTGALALGAFMTYGTAGAAAPAALALYTSVETGVQTHKHLSNKGKK